MLNLNVKCCNCGNEFTINRTTYYYRIRLNPNNPKFYCSNCRSVARKNGIKEANGKLTNEEKEKKKKESSERARKQWTSYNDAKRKEISEIFSKAQKNKIENMNEEELALYKKSQSDRARQESLNMSKEEKEAFSKRCSENTKRRWSNYTEEERNTIRSKQSEGLKRYISTLDEDTLKQRMNKLQQRASESWNKLSNEEKVNKTRIRFINNGHNKYNNSLNELFEKSFSDFINYNKFSMIKEFPSTNITAHCWDYALFKDNELCILIDLDGKYFHADECDYDGLHSREEYDLTRSLSIKQGNSIFIIYEYDFISSINRLKEKLLKTNHYSEILFREYRSMSFPYPEYNDAELLRSYRDLCKLNCDDKYHKSLNVNTRIGDRLIQHFHHSIWHDNIDNKKSPYEAWNSDNTLYEMITNGYLYHSYLNKNKILQGFNIYEPCKRVSILSAGKAKMIIHKYLSEYGEVFDLFSGYGGIMLACISMHKRYIGQDISETHICESLNMVQFLKDNGINMDVTLSVTDSSQTIGTYQCLIANVPSGDEEYQDVHNIHTSDEWIDICLNNFKCKRYVFIVKHTERYADKIVDTINNRYDFIDDYEIILI